MTQILTKTEFTVNPCEGSGVNSTPARFEESKSFTRSVLSAGRSSWLRMLDSGTNPSYAKGKGAACQPVSWQRAQAAKLPERRPSASPSGKRSIAGRLLALSRLQALNLRTTIPDVHHEGQGVGRAPSSPVRGSCLPSDSSYRKQAGIPQPPMLSLSSEACTGHFPS